MSLIQELKRRNVFRVAIAYLAASWLFIEVADTVLPRLPEVFSNPESAIRTIINLVAIGFFPILIFSWFFELLTAMLSNRRMLDVNSTLRSSDCCLSR